MGRHKKPLPHEKRGPKVIDLNWEEFDKLCGIQCTLKEISSWFDCSEDTIERRVKEYSGLKFADYYAQKRGKGLISLRRKQYEVAMSGDKTLLIWLGKQYLGQSDKIESQETYELVTEFTKDETSSSDK